jgi:hypothetical protein
LKALFLAFSLFLSLVKPLGDLDEEQANLLQEAMVGERKRRVGGRRKRERENG